MRTAVDTNVFISLWSGTTTESEIARRSLDQANDAGTIVISPPVYAEMIAAPNREQQEIDAFLQTTGIEIGWNLDEVIWRAAALAYRGYAQRRRSKQGDPRPRRILADFVIGAHALHAASALLTSDAGIYRAAFPR